MFTHSRKNALFTALFLVGFLSFSYTTHAATYFSQTNASYEISTTGPGNRLSLPLPSSTGSVATGTTLYFYLSAPSSSGNLEYSVHFQRCTDSSCTAATDGMPLWTATVNSSTASTYVTSTPILFSINPTSSYRLILNTSDGGSPTKISINGAASSSSPFFVVSDTSIPLGNVDFVYPTNSTGTIPDFTAWSVSLENLSTSSRYSVAVGYAETSSPLSYTFDYETYDAAYFGVTSIDIFGITKNNPLTSLSTTTPRTWYATAYLYQYPTSGFGPPELIGSSPQITFSVTNVATTSYFVAPTYQNSTSTMNATGTFPLAVNCPDNWFSGGLCTALVATFVPSQTQYYGLFDTIESVGNKIPFAYIGMLTDLYGTSYVFTDIEPTEVNIPILGTDIALTPFSATTTYMFVSRDTVSFLRQIIIYVMYLSTLYYGVNRARAIMRHLST